MKKLKLTAFALVLILAANANAGILRFAGRHIKKGAVHVRHGAHRVGVKAKKILY